MRYKTLPSGSATVLSSTLCKKAPRSFRTFSKSGETRSSINSHMLSSERRSSLISSKFALRRFLVQTSINLSAVVSVSPASSSFLAPDKLSEPAPTAVAAKASALERASKTANSVWMSDGASASSERFGRRSFTSFLTCDLASNSFYFSERTDAESVSSASIRSAVSLKLAVMYFSCLGLENVMNFRPRSTKTFSSG
mgnify:FL=1